MSETLAVDDFFKVVEAHGDMAVDSVWRVDDIATHVDYCGEEFPACGCENTDTLYYASSTDGMRSGFEAEASKVARITSNIPFRIFAEIVTEVSGVIHAGSEAEAIALVKKDPQELLDNQFESTAYSRRVHSEMY